MMFWYGGHMMFWQAFLSWTSMIVLFGVVAVAVYVLATRRRPPSDHWEEVQHTLDRRLASGEIDEDEYRRMHDLIGQQH